MSNAAALSADTVAAVHRCITLRKITCAVQITSEETGVRKVGLLTQLGPGTAAQVCGPGFNERTVMVSVNGQCFFVFLQDIEEASPTI